MAVDAWAWGILTPTFAETSAFARRRAGSLTTAALALAVDVTMPALAAVGVAMVYNLSMHLWVLVRYDRLHPA